MCSVGEHTRNQWIRISKLNPFALRALGFGLLDSDLRIHCFSCVLPNLILTGERRIQALVRGSMLATRLISMISIGTYIRCHCIIGCCLLYLFSSNVALLHINTNVTEPCEKNNYIHVYIYMVSFQNVSFQYLVIFNYIIECTLSIYNG